MKLSISIIVLFISLNSQSQTIDTLVAVGNHKLHFNIIKGKGIPILFETGGGADGNAMNNILQPIADKTGATLITYDRAGFGKSTVDISETDISKHNIVNGIEDLELALKKLGYNDKIMLVAHSYGGWYSTLYAARNPDKVKAAVLIDVNHDYYTDEYVSETLRQQKNDIENWKQNNLGFYYMATNLKSTVEIMRKNSFPASIPVTDIVNGKPFWKDTGKIERWINCHKNFVEAEPNRIGIVAKDCGHLIYKDNPNLVIKSIVESYNKI
ncbi:alpha/beta hydrolase [Flavobacterium noncentrifugens]|uniref:Alpha/beta hydrolase fold n=1 Tax=Flavobacterium noncentrifugens TaxID=1128970 RepID=A0A1G9BMB1_9FLAO|nr:alpha/beta fold hydrolase [Flavobacterium noncentrifugens]GEP52299.1 alpha/beta hydrolase [Flavobacterium noncentrifugens]SDK40533.1 alpha/beta hydrolase fold [Flavobacterium noncentrifugens]